MRANIRHFGKSAHGLMRRLITACRVIALAAVWVASAPFSLAQTGNTGAISGTVTDPAGRVVIGAQVTATNKATGATAAVTTQNGGAYTLPLLLPGRYNVEISKQGFKLEVVDVPVNVTEVASVNVRLQVGSVNEKIEVQATGVDLQPESSSLGYVTSGEMVQNLPLSERNYLQIIALNPTVASDVIRSDTLGHGPLGGNGAGGASSAGNNTQDNNFQMDGAEIDDREASGGFGGGVAIPNPDSIQEFKVQTSQYDATYGRNAGANVDVVTKGGTNEFHGNIWEYNRDTIFNANDYFVKRSELANGQPNKRGAFNQNQFGADVGGPILRNKLLFFTSYQGTRQKDALSTCLVTVQGLAGLTDANRTAAGLGAAFAGQSGTAGTQAADTIQANGSNISPQAIAILQIKVNGQYLIPTVQGGAPGGILTEGIPCTHNEDQFITNGDYIQSSKSKFSGRFFWDDFNENTVPGGSVPGLPQVVQQAYRNASLSHDYAFGTHILNHATVGYHRTFTNQHSTSAFSFSSIGSTVPTFDQNYPTVNVAGSFSIAGNAGGVSQNVIAENTYEVVDSLSYQLRRHFLRFGGGITRVQINNDPIEASQLNFNTFADFLIGACSGTGPCPNAPSTNGNGGTVSNISGSLDRPGLYTRALRVWDADAYVQDDYKVTPRLMLNLGFRYDREGDFTDALGRATGFDPSLITPYSVPATSGSLVGFVVSSNYVGTPPTGVTKLNTNYGFPGNGQNTLNPRIGLSWQPVDKIVVRGGFGVYHSAVTGQAFHQTTVGQPFTLSRLYQASQNATASWGQPFQPYGTFVPSFTPYTPATLLTNTAFSMTYRPPTVKEYSLNTQTQLAKDLVLEVGYVGSRGVHVLGFRSVNEACVVGAPLNADGCPVSPLPSGTTTNTTANVQQRVPYEGFSPGGLFQLQSQGDFWYNALESRLTQRMRHGLEFETSYTFSKELDTFANTANNPNGGTLFGDQNHPLYGPDSYIRPHRLAVSYVYRLPSVSNLHSLKGEVFGGWQWSGVAIYQTGHYLTLQSANPNAIIGTGLGSTASLASGCSIGQLVNPGSVQSRLGLGTPGTTTYFNLNCLTQPGVSPYASPQTHVSGSPACPTGVTTCPQATGVGNLGVGIVQGPNQANWDMSFGKHFAAGWPDKTANVEFRADFFNAFNHTQFADPSLSLPVIGGFNTAGEITSTAVSPRIIQLVLRLNF